MTRAEAANLIEMIRDADDAGGELDLPLHDYELLSELLSSLRK